MRRIYELGPLIVQQNWDEMMAVINSFSQFDRVLKEEFMKECKEHVTSNLFLLLDLAIAYKSPRKVIEGILNIEPRFASELLMTPDVYSVRGDFLIEIACKCWSDGDIIEVLLRYDDNDYSLRTLHGEKKRNLLHYATICALSRGTGPDGHPVLFPHDEEGEAHEDGRKDHNILLHELGSGPVDASTQYQSTSSVKANEFRGSVRGRNDHQKSSLPSSSSGCCYEHPQQQEEEKEQFLTNDCEHSTLAENQKDHQENAVLFPKSSCYQHSSSQEEEQGQVVSSSTFVQLMLYLCTMEPLLVTRKDKDNMTPIDIAKRVTSSLRKKKNSQRRSDHVISSSTTSFSSSVRSTASYTTQGKRRCTGETSSFCTISNFDEDVSYLRRVNTVCFILIQTAKKAKIILKERNRCHGDDSAKTECAQVCDETDFLTDHSFYN